MERNMRKTIVGIVVSDKMDKSIAVEVETLVKDPKYGKQSRKATKFKVHDEENIAGIGDEAKIMETRPFSKTKNWRLVEIIEKTR